VVTKLDSQLKGRGFESHPILDQNGFKAMPGLISVPNSGLGLSHQMKEKENTGSQMGHT